jgi:aerobic carbon-monoxide dehydrogenase large subunit
MNAVRPIGPRDAGRRLSPFVVAESGDLAKDGADRRRARTAPSVTVTAAALSPDALKLWAEAAGNECFVFTLGDKRAVERGFAQAQHVRRLKLVFNRITAATIKGRARPVISARSPPS